MLNSKSNWFQSTWSWYTVCGCQTYSSTTLRHSRFLHDHDIDANISWGTFWIQYVDILMLIYQQSFKCFENALSYFCCISNNHRRWSMFFQSSLDSGSIRLSASITGQLSICLIICSHVFIFVCYKRSNASITGRLSHLKYFYFLVIKIDWKRLKNQLVYVEAQHLQPSGPDC